MSNSCIPSKYPVTAQVPPLPNTTRGEPCPLDGNAGRINGEKPILSYASGKLVVVQSMDSEQKLPNSEASVLVYRGHQHATSCAKVSTSGTYVASGDTRGKFRVWALDHEEHLCKLETQALSASVRDIAWDGESKRIVFGGERLDNQSECAKAIQWDTGVTQGTLIQHLKGTCCAVAFKPNRPFRIVTGGKEDGKCHFYKGPPFAKMPVENNVPNESAHGKGINCVRYSSNGDLVASVSADKSLCVYDGKTLELKQKKENIHTGNVYACAWNKTNDKIVTASADGTCKLFKASASGIEEEHTWKVAEAQLGKPIDGKAPKGGLQLGCAFLGDGTAVSVSNNNQLTILPMPGSSDGEIKIVTGHNAAIGGIAFDHKNDVFYTGDSDGILCKWNLKDLKALKRISPTTNDDLDYVVHKGAINGLTILGDGSMMSVGWDDTAYCTSKSGSLDEAKKVDITAQPTCVATGGDVTAIGTVKGLMIMKGGKPIGDLVSTSYTSQAVCVSSDGKTIYVGGDDNKIYAYDASGKEQHVIADGHLKPVHSLALSNNGKMLAAGDTRDVCVYDVSDAYKPLVGKSKWCFHLQKITSLSWSPDDKYLASGGHDDSIFLWCLEKKMKRVHYQYAHRGGVVGLSFKKDGLKLVSAGMDSCVVEYDVSKDVAAKFG
eukprot:CAMPEP_0119557100 /NCGR_PEP_ID=MMETSP1352-20130426/8871_1 /TAXON_ID=265584 /ORGANISM="Stauroneis constricta, Strain CCMP1120" /LENGTH=661 /DNA_ID=CAMNT_0007604147 /DNA_START=57 /DNA_END=2042 /DNA_ORIENTATION=+